MERKRFYVYELYDQDGLVFYVGKSSGNRLNKRATQHRSAARRGNKLHVYSKIRKLWQEGSDFTWTIVYESDDEQQALNEEIRLIAFYGRRNLTNETNGGEKNYELSLEARQRIREAASNKSPESRRKLSAALKGNQNCKGRHNKWSDASRAAQSNRMKGKKVILPEWTDERRKAQSERSKGNQYGKGVKHPYRPEVGKAQSERMKGKKFALGCKHSPESIERGVAKNRGKWHGTEEQREATRKRMKGNKIGIIGNHNRKKKRVCNTTDIVQLKLDF